MVAGSVIPFRQRRRPPGPDWRDVWRRLWLESLDQLESYLQRLKREERTMDDLKINAPEGEPVFTFTRTLKAPRELVWRALSQPEHVVAWFGPRGYQNDVLEFDFRVRGPWRIKTTMPTGETITFFGEFVEIARPAKVVQTFSFDQLPPGVHSVDTVELEEEDGVTIYRGHSRFPDIASRDAMIASGMEGGMREGFERLDELLEEWTAKV
jgi:uncharacterized protein YndB with AHSA1/START domain